MREEIEKAKSYAFKLLSYRIRTCKEISDKLKDKGFSQNIITAVTGDLKRMDYLDDHKFAKEFIASRLMHNPKGKKLLRYELSKKGVENQIIDEVINGEISGEKEQNLAKMLAEKVWNKKENLEINKRKAQTYNYLARRGFGADLITRLLEDLK